MKQSIGPLGEINLLTDDELRNTLGHHFNSGIRDWYRGIDYLGIAGAGNATGTISIPGPDSGYCWSLKLVSAQLSATGTLSVYPGDNTNVAPFDSVVATANGASIFECTMRFTSNTVVLKDQQDITLFCSAATILNYRLLVKQVPTEMQGKL